MTSERPVGFVAIVGLGFTVWLFPFAIGMLIFPLQAAMPQLFDGIMVLSLMAITLFLGTKLVTSKRARPVRGLGLGTIWMLICLGIDLPFFLAGPPQMELAAYAQDIGIGYLLIPMVTMSLEYCGLPPK